MKISFAQGKSAWKSTLQNNAQSKGVVGKSTQTQSKKKLEDKLGKAMKSR